MLYDLERDIISSHGIDIVKPLFPYIYFDRYIYMCNPDVTHEQIISTLDRVKLELPSTYYQKILVFGATVNLMKEFHYDFITSMMRDAEFCDWILAQNKWFEPHKEEIESLTHFQFK